MKTNLSPNRERGNLLLAIVALFAAVAVIIIGYRLIQRLQQMPFDPHHGQGTNAEPDITMLNTLSNLTAQYGPLHVEMPEFRLTLPAEALAYEWYTVTQTSTNLLDWTDVDLDWDVALEDVRTNHALPCKFYRALLIY